MRPVIDWLRETFGFGCMAIPLGPASNAARTVWAIRYLDGEGRSPANIAGTLDASGRTVQRHRARLRAQDPDLTPRTSDRTPDR